MTTQRRSELTRMRPVSHPGLVLPPPRTTSPLGTEAWPNLDTIETFASLTVALVGQLRQSQYMLQAEHAKRLKAENAAATDHLTGLPNHRTFEVAYRREIARAHRDHEKHPAGGHLALALVDMDAFKNYNTVYGYSAANKALQAVASVLQANIREHDFVARWGGEEFALILPSQPIQEAIVAVEKLRATVEALAIAPAGVTISIGVASMPEEACEGQALFDLANRRLKQAKAAGRNRILGSGD